MFSNKENVNILTALLVKSGITKAVVCPGSRNSPIVHNLCECASITCYPVTDERSAAFFAIGLCISENDPVVLCVTSGSALLNVAPAIAEAYYRNLPIIVVSADRPAQWIGQADGQTLLQADALAPHVRKSVNLPEPTNDEERWYCNRLVNEALLENKRYQGAPVHINVPISEPLFEYTVKGLPLQRIIRRGETVGDLDSLDDVAEAFMKTKRPMVVIGQMTTDALGIDLSCVETLQKYAVVLYENLSVDFFDTPPLHFDEVLSVVENEERYRPDFLIYMGGTIVSKRLKRFLRGCKDIRSVLIDERGEVCDTFMNLTDVIAANPLDFFSMIEDLVEGKRPTAFAKLWQKELDKAAHLSATYQPAYSQMLAVKRFHEKCKETDWFNACVYGNSTAVRLGNIYSPQYIHVNRGVNGIEGTLSTAVGMAVARTDAMDVCCVIGDLSFFYDQNALWNQKLGSNLCILLLNNGGGGIFHQLSGLEQSPHRNTAISGEHHTSAQGICYANDVKYLCARNETELETALDVFVNGEEGPVLLEVFTNADDDAQVMKTYYEMFAKKRVN